ncbi:hypothetical protein HU200_048776 [Digitaria exilis]|uniref:Uncharacterized protein n=1 Tax=Digitaria exilis TaxID=1010633 RepID=A0A835EAD0_9POAL|nr:hypothetical protein HU200_048776 [Digitaria exilis]
MVSSDSESSRQKNKHKELHREVLGGIVTANGFFTGAVFLSITGTITPRSGIPSNCTAGDDITLKLFLFQICSLGFYLLSSLIATATKLVIVYLEKDSVAGENITYMPNSSSGMPLTTEGPWSQEHHQWWSSSRPLMVSSVGFSAVGSFFMLLSMVNMVQIKLGLLSCGSTLVVITVLVLAVLILAGLVVYLVISWFFLKHVK